MKFAYEMIRQLDIFIFVYQEDVYGPTAVYCAYKKNSVLRFWNTWTGL